MVILLTMLVGVAAAAAAFAAVPRIADRIARRRAVGDGSARTDRTVSPAGPGGGEAGAGVLASIRRAVTRRTDARRLERVRAQLPEALTGMGTSVRAGLSLPQAIQAAGERMPAPLGHEFRAVADACALGATLEAALDAFERRVSLPETRLLVAGLKLSRVTGGALAPLLDQLAATLRERERLRGQVRTLTAQGRLSGWVVGAMPVVLLGAMAALDPAFLRPMLETPMGWTLLGLAAVLEGLGALAIRAVVRVEP